MKKQRGNKKNKKNSIQGYDIVKLRTRRFGAMMIDWYITNMLTAIPVTFFLRGNDYIRTYSFDLETYGISTGLQLGIYAVVVGILYYFFVPSFIWKGQTLGKKICHLQIVKEDGSHITYKDLFIRELIGATTIEGGIVVTATYIRKIIQLFGYISIVTPLKYISYALTLFSIIYAYFNPLSQSFHDKLAKTLVIKKD